MKLAKINIRNYRSLLDITLDIDKDITLIIGRNNSGKTSIFTFVKQVLDGKKHFTLEDYPIDKRNQLSNLIVRFLENTIEYEELKTAIPIPAIDFEVSYEDEGLDESLGALSEFIIDIDVEITSAIIRAEYEFLLSDKAILRLFECCKDKETQIIDEHKIKDRISEVFSDMFVLKIKAVNPNDKTNIYNASIADLQKLFPYHFISAERNLGEDGENHSSTLNKLISNLFKIEEDDDPNLLESIHNLREQINNVNNELRQISEKNLSTIVEKAVGFGYPSAEDITLAVLTNLELDKELSNHSILGYLANNAEDTLPSTHNGLGYKNLLKIAFDLAAFAREAKSFEASCVPLLFIEEPESHMHPQMQQRFSEYIGEYIKSLLNRPIQILITSHSSHIANSFDFSKIRYGRNKEQSIEFLNLMELELDVDVNRFLKKYLTLSRCDLFFADKVILVEGASERILLPDIIERCKEEGVFANCTTPLSAQYYSIMEVGGAYAHIFVPLIEFLGIRCLILTDIDPVTESGDKAKFVTQGDHTSNSTIKWWAKKQGIDEDNKVMISTLLSMQGSKKTIGNIHIEYQVKEEYCGRSFEESLINVNRSLYGLESNCAETDIAFKNSSKTEFALSLLMRKEDYSIPKYIKDGLIWLNEN